MPAKGEARLEVGDILEGFGVRYRITGIVMGSDVNGVWLTHLDGQPFDLTGIAPCLRNNDMEALLNIDPSKPLPENWTRLSMFATAFKATGDLYAHTISIAMRIALGHGLDIDDVNVITSDALNAMNGVTDVVEDTSPITPEWTGDEALQGLSDAFSEVIMQAERHGADHDLIVTEFLMALGIRPGIWSDH